MATKLYSFRRITVFYLSLLCGIITGKESAFFTDFTQALDKIASAPIANKKPFATHFLAIVCALDESSEAMKNTIQSLFRDQMTFITTEPLLGQYRLQKFPAPKDYVFLKPLSSNIFFPFVLCVPKEEVSKAHLIKLAYDPKKAFDKNQIPSLASPIEKQRGLFVEHLSQTQYEDMLSVADFFKKEKIGEDLIQFLSFLLVPKTLYQNEPPRWVFYFTGHGTPYTPYTDNNVISCKSLIEDHGTIAGLPVNNFKTILTKLINKNTIALLHIASCFGGGINIGDLLKDILSKCTFFITTDSITGETCTISSVTLYDEKIKKHFFEEEDISPKKFFSILKNATLDTIETLLPEALVKMQPQHRSLASQIQAIKPFNKKYFMEPAYPHLLRLDKKTIKNYQDKKNNVIINALPKTTVILLYANTIPLCIDLSNTTNTNLSNKIETKEFFGYPISITSAIPGATFHTIQEIKTNNSYFNHLFIKFHTLFVTALFPDINTRDNRFEAKLFHLQKISGMQNAKNYNEEVYELWISFDPAKSDTEQKFVIEILLCATEIPTIPKANKPLIQYFITQSNENILTAQSKPIDSQDAKKWIERFEQKIEMLKKIAPFQAPYRLLKDADIETIS